MSKNYYKLYLDSVLDLASTIVIKSEMTADYINDLIKLNYGSDAVNPYDKTTWKYYLNVCGKYHPSDTVITITSLDNQAQITFDKLTLDQHPITKENYRYDTRYYRELITKYPDQVMFINGCLYPADMTYAIESPDGSVLAYPSHLVEEHEETLIRNIESWITKYKARWNNKQFALSDNQYLHAHLGLMYLNLVPVIINLRLEACKTNEAHSFHVRQYLASHGSLDVFLDNLTLKQALFLYRNICYIERNNGRKEILSWLIEKLLTDRNIPIAEYSMRHEVSNLTTNYHAETKFRRKNLNNIYSGGTNGYKSIDLNSMLLKERPLTVGNPDYIDEEFNRIDRKFQNSLSGVVATKVLESSIIDTTGSDVYPLIEYQLNHWAYLSSISVYKANVTFNEPRTGEEITLSTLDAFIYYFYLVCKSVDVKLTDIPKVLCQRVCSLTPVQYGQLRNLCTDQYVDDETVNLILYNQVSTFPTISSVRSFNSKIDEVFSYSKVQQKIISFQQDHFKRGLVENMVTRLYRDIWVDLVPTQTSPNYTSWFFTTGLDRYDYTRTECEALYLDIFNKATGGTLHLSSGISDIQKSMVKLLEKLSSYSVQFITEINQEAVKPLNWAAIRLGRLLVRENNKNRLELADVLPLTQTVLESDQIQIPVVPAVVRSITDTVVSNKDRLEIKVKPYIGKDLGTIHTYVIRTGTISINPCFVNDPNFVGGIHHLPAYDSFYSLTPEQQATQKDVYYDVFQQDPNAGKVNIRNIVFRDVINGFRFFNVLRKQIPSFKYFFIPNHAPAALRTLLTVEIDAFYSNMGTYELPGYKLFTQEHIGSMLKFFAKLSIINGFKNTSGIEIADAGLISDMLGIGTSLDIFKYVNDTYELPAMLYSGDQYNLSFQFTSDNYEMSFAKPFFASSFALQASNGGDVINALKFVGSSAVIGGYTAGQYNLVGFSYNGTNLNFE